MAAIHEPSVEEGPIGAEAQYIRGTRCFESLTWIYYCGAEGGAGGIRSANGDGSSRHQPRIARSVVVNIANAVERYYRVGEQVPRNFEGVTKILRPIAIVSRSKKASERGVGPVKSELSG